MGRPAKTLAQHVRDGSFRARVHHSLLSGPLLAEKALEKLQSEYKAARSERERRAIALDFQERARRVRGPRGPSGLGEPGGSGDVADFIAQNFRHTKGPSAGERFVLEAWQERFVEAFERRDDDGFRVFKRGLFGVARGNGKSPTAAALALRELVVRTDSPDVLLGAAAKDQADVVFRYARGFVESGPLADLLRVGRHEIVNPTNDGVLRKVSADGYLQHGLNPSAVVLDELWAFRTDKQIELFDAVDSAIHKRPGGYWLAITTAGSDRQSLLGRLHGELFGLGAVEVEPGLTVVEDEAGGVLMHWYGADADADFDDENLWEAVNPASFVATEALRMQRKTPSMSRSTFGRLHCNAWIAEEAERWIPTDRWEALRDPDSRIEPGATVCIGGDGSRSYDTSAIAWAARAPDGRIDCAARVFSVRPDVPHHVLHQTRIDYADIQDSLLELAEGFDVAEIAFDPRYLEVAMETVAARLDESSVFPIEPHGRLHREALAAFERQVIEGSIRHADDPVIAEQLSWTGVDRYDNGDPRRLRKLERSRPIDVSIALALAVWRVVTDERPSSIYETRGLLSV